MIYTILALAAAFTLGATAGITWTIHILRTTARKMANLP